MASDLVVSGLGVISAIGQGKTEFADALLSGEHAFGIMQRPGRQCASTYMGAEIRDIAFPERIAKQALPTTSLSAQAALFVLHEALDESRLFDVDPTRIGLIVGGSNFQQRELTLVQDSYRDRTVFLKSTYGLSFMDSDLCVFCMSQFGIRGLAYSVGGATARGQLAIIQAAQAALSRQVDVCIT